MVLPIEIGFVDCGGVDQLFQFALHVCAQAREIAGERGRSGRDHPLLDAAFHEIAPCLREGHSRMTIQIIAQPAIFLGVEQLGLNHEAPVGTPRRRSATTLMAKPRNGSSGKRSAQRERAGAAAASAISPSASTAAAQTLACGSVSISAHNQRGPSAPPSVAHEIACQQPHVRVRVGEQLRQVWPDTRPASREVRPWRPCARWRRRPADRARRPGRFRGSRFAQAQ